MYTLRKRLYIPPLIVVVVFHQPHILPTVSVCVTVGNVNVVNLKKDLKHTNKAQFKVEFNALFSESVDCKHIQMWTY